VEPKSPSSLEHFSQAAQTWDLDRLYADLAAAKREFAPHKKRGLTEVETERLRGLLCGYSPADIATVLHLSPGGLLVSLGELYRYLEVLTQREPHTLKNWRDVVDWLEVAGYRKGSASTDEREAAWQDFPDIPTFYGRTEELEVLKQWVTIDRCRVVAVVGMAGVGKTALVAKLVHELAVEFDRVVWLNLGYVPPFPQTLTRLLAGLGRTTSTVGSAAEGIWQLVEQLRHQRCAIVLDGLEAMLQAEEFAGRYAPEHQVYRDLIKTIAQTDHQSCLCLTSQEKTPEIAAIASPNSSVRCLQIGGLDAGSAQSILIDRGLSHQKNILHLIELYRGNPLALKMVSSTIAEIFNGNIDEFLQGSSLFIGDFGEIISGQFQRLSALEHQILYALALERQPMTFLQLRDVCASWASTSKLAQALDSLGRRSLLEKTPAGFTLGQAIAKAATDRLIEQICREVWVAHQTQNLDRTQLLRHQLLLQFQTHGLNDEKVLNYRKILLKVESELRAFLQETTSVELDDKLESILNLIPKLAFE
jgi:DNA-binding CsgD family transcriptional regulator